ncbi:unnamed protein product [Ilex paraguariensis]|uniref:Uncharacterized protein n=1 Tax=Ilex paraguariensis TaxID=185542 RepID=A0ABC8RSK1_9AQUA
MLHIGPPLLVVVSLRVSMARSGLQGLRGLRRSRHKGLVSIPMQEDDMDPNIFSPVLPLTFISLLTFVHIVHAMNSVLNFFTMLAGRKEKNGCICFWRRSQRGFSDSPHSGRSQISIYGLKQIPLHLLG